MHFKSLRDHGVVQIFKNCDNVFALGQDNVMIFGPICAKKIQIQEKKIQKYNFD